MPRIAARLCALLVASWLSGANAAPAESAADAGPGPQPRATDDAPDATRDADEAAQPPAAPRNQPPARERQSGAPRRSSDDVFRPSEEISEDLAVSYPVDI